MNEHKASRIQKFFQAIFPASWAKSMEESSRQWMVKCPHCDFERSIWAMGGVKWKASGWQKNYMRCVNCGKRGWHLVYR